MPSGIFDSPLLISEKCLCFKRFYCRKTGYANVFLVKRHFSSEVGLEDSVKLVQDTTLEDENENESVSEPSFSVGGGDCGDDEPSQNEIELSETETDPSEKTAMEKQATSALFEAIVNFPGIAVHAALDKWVAEGNELSREEVFLVMINFRKSRMYEMTNILSKSISRVRETYPQCADSKVQKNTLVLFVSTIVSTQEAQVFNAFLNAE
ncbi:hypothetical protein PanWU01x14_037340 [Parasponia andersonii]|uniref:Pentatricopeptide repeat n=1 Tax=Parasponia andersonii TaxID=3476 RepID=A0A2P5DSQ8_PARAD|nr:hypothetical protein PanWU01x14_037340 [Parasponia andersonii]